ncbi:hypothetical protein [Sulfurimonas hydrogeniphila]|uniref:hypothetical protein n=1 Tax=Sulfurimonas hydrogeniphila TaxID=2509341 RepID=UPI00125EDE05|nr:hypothetical protein [Sulfurimonas hydrogeniphila]
MRDLKATFIEKLHECNQHKKRLLLAKKKLDSIIPLNIQKYNNLNDDYISYIDQLIFRFSKLQDTMGDKLFPALLELMGEEVKSKPFIDRLNRLEELGIVDKNEWLKLRKDRNEIAHEYSFNQDEVVDSINLIYDITYKLLFFMIFFINIVLINLSL